jgi:hypothetical protein
MLCLAFGLMLGFAPRRAAPWAGAVLLLVASLAAAFLSVPEPLKDLVFSGCWISVIVVGAGIYLPRGPGFGMALALAANSGAWAGAVIASEGAPSDLARALPWVLAAIPAAWIAQRPARIALKVVMSWLMAVSLLAALLPLAPTPGYEPDHME